MFWQQDLLPLVFKKSQRETHKPLLLIKSRKFEENLFSYPRTESIRGTTKYHSPELNNHDYVRGSREQKCLGEI